MTVHTVDIATRTADGRLRHIAGLYTLLESVLVLVEAWVCRALPASIQPLLQSIRKHTKDDPVDLRHLKRVQPCGEALEAVVCSVELFPTAEAVAAAVFADTAVPPMRRVRVPRLAPATQAVLASWSQEYWPLVWKGAPWIQHLKAIRLDVDTAESHLAECVDNTTLMVDPRTNTVVARGRDMTAAGPSPLRHSVMECIAAVARQEVERRAARGASGKDAGSSYLCSGLDVYTTHQPCPMCTMALVHSRVGQLFVADMLAEHGGEGGLVLGVHQHHQLNWRFDAWERVEARGPA